MPRRDALSPPQVSEVLTVTHGDTAPTEAEGSLGGHRAALIEITTISIFMVLSLMMVTAVMAFITEREPPKNRRVEIQGDSPEVVWNEHDTRKKVNKFNMCQNFPRSYREFSKFVERPYQVRGDACSNYYELACGGICHLLPPGVCFAETFKKWYEDCDPDLSPESQVIWRDFIHFNADQRYIPRRWRSSCDRLILTEYGTEIEAVTGRNHTMRTRVMDRISFLINYVNSKKLCADGRLMLYERLCLSLCCNDVSDKPEAGIRSAELGRLICQAVVSWRTDFTAYFRCRQNPLLIRYCGEATREPEKCQLA
ncbi:uncharacterized protein LOC114828088 [Galendromus occidentalis]|uniref:Uncharacterized protein LOC114828088 n=1 Tax=Galendromus occidentalis TaxID=34638 RepID=A0AAJ7WHY9_9ACAR|nr:uncharacterized protein LOC114828088 [Galendromus occidentalis]